MKRTVKRPPATMPVKAKTLAQAQADFTAEGAPPPGLVANTPPVVPAVKKSVSAKFRNA